MRTTNSMAVVLVAVLSLSAGTAHAQDGVASSGQSSTPNMLLVNPGDLVNGIVSLEYERALGRWFGLTIGAAIMTFRGAFTPAEQHSYLAFVPELGARIHLIRPAPGGLWFGPYVGLGWVAARSDGTPPRAYFFGLGGAFGYNFILGKHFVFQLGAGGGIGDYGEGLTFAPRIRLGLGAAF